MIDNAAAVELFNRLAAYSYGAYENTGKYDSKKLHDFAEDALRAVATAERLRVQGYFIGQYNLAVQQWNDEFIQLSVVCPDTDSKACKTLHYTALTRFNHPRRIVKLQTPGYYPARGEAALFICNSNVCSSPIQGDDKKLEAKAHEWFSRLTEL